MPRCRSPHTWANSRSSSAVDTTPTLPMQLHGRSHSHVMQLQQLTGCRLTLCAVCWAAFHLCDVRPKDAADTTGIVGVQPRICRWIAPHHVRRNCRRALPCTSNTVAFSPAVRAAAAGLLDSPAWWSCSLPVAGVAAGRSHPHQQMRSARKTWAGARADRLPAGSMPPFVLCRRSFKHPSSALAFDRALRLRFLPRTTTAGFRNRPAAHQLHSGSDDAPVLCFKRQRERQHACLRELDRADVVERTSVKDQGGPRDAGGQGQHRKEPLAVLEKFLRGLSRSVRPSLTLCLPITAGAQSADSK